MNKLTKTQEATKDDLVKRLNEARDKVVEAYAMVMDAIDTHLNHAINQYNEVLSDVEGFRDELVNDMENYYDERSEKWQEGDAGSAYQEWKGEWEGLSLDEVAEVDHPDEPQMDLPDELEQLNNEVGGG